ncbi:Planctomycete cytochrome C [Polystyrenella longa]|uniref:Planctomycete cytochrome C n=1 Tax=Polystyrenella longa TaxID=2528007 RepID=A0A518CSP8_9PLAN|nr:PSD1 and planctomycete cytochrome C domain-containing protein [Polystyrenella longa]QDU82240.1 Planctomycete cytochrome C [Polystyrenella longa]
MHLLFKTLFLLGGFLLAAIPAAIADELPVRTPDEQKGIDFFESRIRPVLSKHCYECHAADSEKVLGGLLLDSREAMQMGGDSGPAVIPGDTDESLILGALRHENFEMPPTEKLPENVIADFEAWIKMGAPDPRDGKPATVQPSIDLEQGREFWSFQPIIESAVPQLENDDWAESKIDLFILAQLQSADIEPVGDASRASLIRRVSYALTGLPPTAEEVLSFLEDPRPTPEALAERIDIGLASSHFGERWGRHWLDVVRFAESSGGGRSLMFKEAWRFRDYVIESFNNDKPINHLIREHIAGDLLPADNVEQAADQLIATGFMTLGPTNYEQQDKTLLRMDLIDEQIDTTGRAFMGMTLNCARCHDHKFDPIPTKDYYALAGIFGSTEVLTFANVSGFVTRQLPVLPEQQVEIDELKMRREETRQQLKQAESALKQAKNDPSSQSNLAELNAEVERLKKVDRQVTNQLRPILAYAMSVNEVAEPRDGHLHIRGSAHNVGPVVERGFLSVIPSSEEYRARINDQQSGRLELADWIVDEQNPLTARVYVNRIWQHLLGEGLVRTPDNFGLTGQIPSHPELLDYLASRFMQEGWSTKQLVREIMLSHVYRIATEHDPHPAQVDSENRLLWRAHKKRLDAEAIRDTLLFLSGELDLKPGGFTIRHFTTYDYGYEFDTVRRSVYVPVFRNAMLDLFEAFDVANPNLVVGRRSSSTLPTQSLYLMNSPFMREQAELTAKRLLSQELPNDETRLEDIYLQALGRMPTENERQLALEYLRQFQGTEENIDDDVEGWTSLCHSLFCSLDFLFLN